MHVLIMTMICVFLITDNEILILAKILIGLQELNAFLDVSSEVNDDRVDTETNSKLIDFVLANRV